MALLNVLGIDTYYGDSHILYDLSLEVADGEVVCLLGRNGAGKTTTVRSIIGAFWSSCGIPRCRSWSNSSLTKKASTWLCSSFRATIWECS